MTTARKGPLEGVRVVDLTTTFLGPYATLLLAEMGADVIKVEAPGGDVARHVGTVGASPAMSSVFLAMNRNKQSVVLDLKVEEGRERLRRLSRSADVFIHNMRPSTVEGLGFSYSSLEPDNPRLVYCAAYGFGQDGPLRDRPAYDDVIQGAAGIADLQGRRGDRPEFVATPIADKTVGLLAALAIVSALYSRDRSGRGCLIDVPMMESMVAYLSLEQLGGLSFVPPRGDPFYYRTLSPYRRPYKTLDGYIAIMVYTDEHWLKVLEVLGERELLADPRLQTVADRARHIDELYERLDVHLARRTTDEWLKVFDGLDVPAVRVSSLPELLTDPQVQSSGVFHEADHPREGRIRYARTPWTFSGHDPVGYRPAPTLGEHTDSARFAADAPDDGDGER